MKRSMLLVLFIICPGFVFASWEQVVIKSGDFSLELRYNHTVAMEENGEVFQDWKTYWPLIQLIFKNEELLKAQNVEVLLAWNHEDHKYSASFQDGPGTLVNKFLQQDSLDELISSLAFNMKHGMRLKDGNDFNSVRIYRFAMPFQQGRNQLRYDRQVGEQFSLYMGAVDGMSFYKEYNLIVTDFNDLQALMLEYQDMNFQVESYIVNRNTIDLFLNPAN